MPETQTSSKLAGDLESLVKLRDAGKLTEQQFEAAKNAVLRAVEGSEGRLPGIAGDVLKETLLHAILGLIGVDALVSYVGGEFIAGTTFVGVFLYVLPLTLAVAAVVTVYIGSEDGFLSLLVAAGALFIAVEVQDILPGARRIVPANPTCHTAQYPLGRVTSCLLTPGLSPLGWLGYVVTAVYGYVKVYGAGLVVAGVAIGAAAPFVVGVAWQIARGSGRGKVV